MATQDSVLVLGARGRFGSAAVRAFAQAGWQVHAQCRPGSSPAAEGAAGGVHWFGAEPDDTARLAREAAGASVVVQALSPPYTHKAWRTQVPQLTAAAARIGRELRATLLLPASVYNFGASMAAELDEDAPQRPTTFKGRIRKESEAVLRRGTEDGRMKVAVVRGGDFFGSGTGSWFDLVLARDLQQGRMTYPGAPDVPTPWAYLPDMARAFVALAGQRHRLGAFEQMHFAGHALTGQDWADAFGAVAREQGWVRPDENLRVRRIVWPWMQAVGLFVPTVAALCEVRYLWRTPHALRNRRLAQLIGEEPRTPFPEAVRAALAERGLLAPAPRALPESAARVSLEAAAP